MTEVMRPGSVRRSRSESFSRWGPCPAASQDMLKPGRCNGIIVAQLPAVEPARIIADHGLSGSNDGFGGDLRYGEADGLSGADRICAEIAEYSMPGAGQKQWRAFLSVNAGRDGQRLCGNGRF